MRKIMILIIWGVSELFAEGSFPEPVKKPTICLNMIVKNESAIIEKCLASAKPFIDYWVIVDTGSNDGTQQIIQKFMKDIPGELHEKPWVGFDHNRTEALELAKNKADYLLFVDADEEIVVPSNFTLPALEKDYYLATFKDKELLCSRIFLVSTRRDWKYVGAMHEQLSSTSAQTYALLKDLCCNRKTDLSARSQDSKKYHKDAQILEEALRKDPLNTRNIFYLAQSYLNAKEYNLALQNYQKRSVMGGDEQEVFWSLFLTGAIERELNFPFEMVVSSYQKAYQNRPTRVEPLVHLCNYLIDSNQMIVAYCIGKLAITISYPEGEVGGNIELSAYQYGSRLALAKAALGLGKYEEAQSLLEVVSLHKNLPEDVFQHTQKLLQLCLKKK